MRGMTMSKKVLFSVLFLMFAPIAAQASCESVIQDIKQKIINNGVAENAFKLEAVPNDEADNAGGQIVGHCQNETYKIIYTRFANGNNEAQ